MRTGHSQCPHEVLQFILDLIKFNDNRLNKVSEHASKLSLKLTLTFTMRTLKSLLESCFCEFSIWELISSYKQKDLVFLWSKSMNSSFVTVYKEPLMDNFQENLRIVHGSKVLIVSLYYYNIFCC